VQLKQSDLDQFTGTENWYKHPLNPKITYADGAKYLAEVGGAYWLLDEIALANRFDSVVRREEFQVWQLKKMGETSEATLECEDGNGRRVFAKNIPYTDFPLSSVTLYCENNVIYLPSER
jgi:hypothetical protein